MIFIGGISQGQKTLGFSQAMICGKCGRYCNISVFMVYTYFSFFFVPLFKWGKKYYAVSNCCDTAFPLSPELGRAIEKGEAVTLREEDLQMDSPVDHSNRHCRNCGYYLTDEFIYCPKCGEKI